MVAKLIARGIRAVLDDMGYVLWKKEFLQYGISVYEDIARLNRAWGRSVGTFFDVAPMWDRRRGRCCADFQAPASMRSSLIRPAFVNSPRSRLTGSPSTKSRSANVREWPRSISTANRAMAR